MAKNDSNIGKTKKPKNANVKKATTKKGKSSSYNAFMTSKLEELKEDKSLDHKARMKKMLDAWKKEQKGK